MVCEYFLHTPPFYGASPAPFFLSGILTILWRFSALSVHEAPFSVTFLKHNNRPVEHEIPFLTTNWVVLKFGGTSVSGRPQWDGIASLAQERLSQGKRVVLVCSALSGVTNALTALADDPDSTQKHTDLLNRHRHLASELELSESAWLQSAEQRLADCLKSHKISDSHASRAQLLAMGEWLSTRQVVLQKNYTNPSTQPLTHCQQLST